MTKTKTLLKIQNRIHVLRAEKRITQAELAEGVGVTRATINALEGGDYNPSLELSFRISRYFNVDINHVFWVEQSNNSGEEV